MPTTANAAHLEPWQIAEINRLYPSMAMRAYEARCEDLQSREVAAVNPAQLSFMEVK